MDPVYSGGREVAVFPGGGFSVVVPDPHAEVRGEVLRGMAAEAAALQEDYWQGQPPRRERAPLGFDAEDRERQERSLGRGQAKERRGGIGGKTEVCYLHPMADDVYLLTLAGMLPELAPRLDRMTAEMVARPEEYGSGEARRVFDIALFRECGLAWPPVDGPREVSRAEAAADSTLAAFICYVAAPRSLHGIEAGGLVLSGLGWWSERSRWVVGTWLRWPWFCYGE